VYTITKQFEFEAAHHLTNVHEDHKCRRVHGHNYAVVVELRAERLDRSGFVVDFGDLNDLKDHINSVYDHRDLNEVMSVETTAENLARTLFDWCAGRWSETVAITVAETRGTTATYRP
jgi:6-pyruvoyltetrahydropterin/6-carboxytetrahydropterin synthase